MILLAFGANISSQAGRPHATIAKVWHSLPGYGVKTLTLSSIRTYQAWPDPSDPPFSNAVGEVAWHGSPEALLEVLLHIEMDFGRLRTARNAPRSLDLDLIDFDGLCQNTDQLTLPHPRLHQRLFVLEPLAEIAPDWRHPATAQTVSDLIAALKIA